MDDAEFEAIPFCNSSSQLRRSEELLNDLIWMGKWRPESCTCENLACAQFIYGMLHTAFKNNLL